MNDPYIRKHDDATGISPVLLGLLAGGNDEASEDEEFTPGENEEQLFHYKWLQMKTLKRWVDEVSDNDQICWCKYCMVAMPAKMSILLAHHHKRSHKMLGAEYHDTHWGFSYVLDDMRELSKVIKMCKDTNKSDEQKLLRLTVYTIARPKMALGHKKQKNFDYTGSDEEDYNSDGSSSTSQDDLLYNRDSYRIDDSPIPVELSRGRFVALITKVLAPECRAQIVEDVGDGCFSLYVDNDISGGWGKYFGLIIKYISPETDMDIQELVTKFLTLVRVEKKLDAELEADALKKALRDYGLNLNKLTAIAIDDGNRGEGNKLFKLLEKHLPNLTLIPCLHHSAQTVCSQASLYPMDMTKPELILYHTNAFFTNGSKYHRHRETYKLLQNEDDPMNELIYKDTTWSHRLPAVRQVYKHWDKLKTFFSSFCGEDQHNGPGAMKLFMKDEVHAHLAVLEFILSKFEPIHNLLDVKNIHPFRVYEKMENLMTFFHDLIAIKPDDATMEEGGDDVANGDATMEKKNEVTMGKCSTDVVMEEESDVTAKKDSDDVATEEKTADVSAKKKDDTPDLSKWNADKLFALVDHNIEDLNSEQKKELSEVMIKFLLEIIEQLKGRIPDKSIKRISVLFNSEGNVVADEMLKNVDEETKSKIMKQISEIKTSQPNVTIDKEFWKKLKEEPYKELLKFCEQMLILPHINYTSGKILHALRYAKQQWGFGSDPDQFEFVNSMLIVRYYMKTTGEDWKYYWIYEELEAKVTADLEIVSMKKFLFDEALKLMIYTNDLI